MALSDVDKVKIAEMLYDWFNDGDNDAGNNSNYADKELGLAEVWLDGTWNLLDLAEYIHDKLSIQ